MAGNDVKAPNDEQKRTAVMAASIITAGSISAWPFPNHSDRIDDMFEIAYGVIMKKLLE